LLDSFILKIKKAESPGFRFLKRVAQWILRPTPPPVPRFLKPVFRIFYEAHWTAILLSRVVTLFYRQPLFQSRCASVGRNLVLDGLPFVTGHVEIHLGNHNWLGGKVSIISGGTGQPRFIMKDHAELGWNVSISVTSEVLIEEHARVSYDCRISDSDGHPRQADLRAQNLPPHPRDIRPVRIGRHAWIGNGTHIMKGVTIGEGAIIGANSVVINDIPPYALAMGNPATVILKNYGKPSRQAAPPPSTSAPGEQPGQ
jgi:acetyltransferase-like isoleucine patch superfamily enzyme